MATLKYNSTITTEPHVIQSTLEQEGILYERWGLREGNLYSSEDVVRVYKDDIQRLKQERGYKAEDVIAINPDTQGLDETLKNFRREHIHTDDEVRFVVEGVGVFHVYSADEQRRYTVRTEAGDLIVIPAHRKHSFELTEKRSIRCVRLFMNDQGWKAIYT
ncbi:MAG: cupin domain-containing protein [Oligoflexales bacterium]